MFASKRAYHSFSGYAYSQLKKMTPDGVNGKMGKKRKMLVKEFGYDTDLISKTDSSQFKQKAKRPSYSCLGCDKVIKEFGLELYTTEKALKIMKEQVAEEAPNLLGK